MLSRGLEAAASFINKSFGTISFLQNQRRPKKTCMFLRLKIIWKISSFSLEVKADGGVTYAGLETTWYSE